MLCLHPLPGICGGEALRLPNCLTLAQKPPPGWPPWLTPAQPRPDPTCMLRATFPILASSRPVVQHPTWASASWPQLLSDALHSQADSLEAGLEA